MLKKEQKMLDKKRHWWYNIQAYRTDVGQVEEEFLEKV